MLFQLGICCLQGVYVTVLDLINCLMDPFDDVLPVAPAARSRPGAKFVPKAKSKQPPRKEIRALEQATSSKDGVSGNECQNAVASTLSMPVEESMGILNSKDANATNSETGNPEQVSVKGGSAALVDDSTITASEGDADHNSTNFLKSACEVACAEFELDPFSNILPDPGTRNAHKFQPKIKPRPRVGNTPTIASASSNVVMEKSVELPTSCTNDFQSFQTDDNGISGLNQSTHLPLPTLEMLSTTDLPNKFDDMSICIPIADDNESLAEAPPSQLDSLNDMLSEDVVHNGTRIWPSSFAKSSGEAGDIFSGLESLDDFLTQTATNKGKPALHTFNEKGAEENLVTPTCGSINSFGECDTIQVQRCSEHHTTQDSLTFNGAAVLNEDDSHTNNRRSETEEVVNMNPARPGDDVFDYQYMKSGEDPTSGIPVHEELKNAADNPTLAEFLHTDVTMEKEVNDANERKKDSSTSYCLRKHRRSSVASEEDKGGKTSRQLRKQAARKPANSSLNEDVEGNNDHDPPYNSNGDEILENDEDYEVDYSSKKRRASTNSQKKSEGKSGKTSQKRKKSNDGVEKSKEPPKKFSHSTRRRKRCVDKALLEIPEDELELRTLPMKDIILLAEHRERLKKKDPTTSNTSSNHQSGGDSLHEANAYYKEASYYEEGACDEEEFAGSEDGRNPDDDQANEEAPSTSSLFNYQSFMQKAPRGKWSKQDTEIFYEAVRELGTDFSMIQQLFPGKTRHQIKLKYKKEERQHPLRLTDAVNNRAKVHTHFKLLIERLKQVSTKAEEDASRDASDFMTTEEVVDPTPGTNNEEAAEVATTRHDVDVKAQEDSEALHSPEQSVDDNDDDFQKWSQYKSAY